MLCDQHVVKMCTEAAQVAYTILHLLFASLPCDDSEERKTLMFSTAPWVEYKDRKTKEVRRVRGYSTTHQNHPIVRPWGVACPGNFCAIVGMCLAICKEYEKRFNKTHSVYKHAVWLDSIPVQELPYPEEMLVDAAATSMTLPPLCVYDEYKNLALDLSAIDDPTVEIPANPFETATEDVLSDVTRQQRNAQYQDYKRRMEALRIVYCYRVNYQQTKIRFKSTVARYWYSEPPAFLKNLLPRESYDKEYSDNIKKMQQQQKKNKRTSTSRFSSLEFPASKLVKT